MGEMRDSDWSRENLLRSDWLIPSVATITTIKHQRDMYPLYHDVSLAGLHTHTFLAICSTLVSLWLFHFDLTYTKCCMKSANVRRRPLLR